MDLEMLVLTGRLVFKPWTLRLSFSSYSESRLKTKPPLTGRRDIHSFSSQKRERVKDRKHRWISSNVMIKPEG